MLLLAAGLLSVPVQAAPFTVTIVNTGTNTAYGWSAGLITFNPLLPLGLTPRPGTPQYAAYAFTNSNCNPADAICGSGCNDNGNAIVLARRMGLTLGVDAWLVPPLPAGVNATAVVTVDAPPGARLSYISWVNNTSVFDDFIALHVPGDNTELSVPLYDANGAPITPSFRISGYDSNSTSPTNGSGATCSQECPTQSTGCYVAPGNASIGFPGLFPEAPATTPALTLTASGPTTTSAQQVTYTFEYRNLGAGTISGTQLSYALPAGVSYVSSSNSGSLSGSTVTWPTTSIAPGATVTRSVTVNLGAFGGTTAHTGTVTWLVGSRRFYATATVTTVYSASLPVAWTYTEPAARTTDGLAVANLTGNTGSEVLVLAPARGTSGPGRAIVLRSDTGAELSSFSPGTGRNVMGLPLAEQLSRNANSTLEYVFGEPLPLAQDAGVYARTGSSAGLWTSLPWAYSAYWNMGPSSANTTGNGTAEVVVSDWEGNVRLLSNTGAVLASYSTWTNDQDHPFGHVALGDVDGNGTLEAALVGYRQGQLIVLNGNNLSLRWKSPSLRALYGDVAYGSGPAIGNIDGDTRKEVVVATWGTNSDVYAFDVQSGACEHRWNPAGTFYYSSPVIGDVDGSGTRSVVVVSANNGTLWVLKAGATGCDTAGGTIAWSHVIKEGEGSIFTPVLYDVSGDGTLDVIAASRTRLSIIDVRNRQVLMSFEDPTAAFSPSAAVANADTGSAVRELYVSGWRNSKVYRLTLPSTATATTDWPTFMGGNTRSGER